MKNYDKNTPLSYLICLDANNLYGWAMSKYITCKWLKWENDLSKFTENFIKNYDEG